MRIRRSALLQLGLGATLAWSAPTLAATQTVVVWSRDAGVPAPIVAAFEAAHPDIKIDNVGVPCGQMDDKLGVALAANQRIDVVLNPCMRTWPYLAHKGYFTDLNPYIKRDRAALDAGGVIPLAYQIQAGPNGLSGVAFQLRTGLMVTYNVDHFDAAGLARPAPTWGASWSWDDFLADAKKLTLTDPAGKTKQYAVDFWDSDPTAVGFPEAWGGSVLPADAYGTRVAQRFTLNTPENVAGYEAMVGLSRLGLRGGSQGGFRGER
ncbi:MAG TPA: extracellular solute-binding protein, partial [Limnochordia bacterium]|nr:extracellular solute-binding protein [Limnochordia bacterium]